MSGSRPQRYSRIKSFRLDIEMTEKLNKGASKAGKTESALVAELLEDRLLVDPLVPRIREILLSASSLDSLLGSVNVDALEVAAAEAANIETPVARELYESQGRNLRFRLASNRDLGYAQTMVSR